MRLRIGWIVLLSGIAFGGVAAADSAGHLGRLPQDRGAGIVLVREAAREVRALGETTVRVDPAAYRRLWDRGAGRVVGFPLPDRDPVDLDVEAFSLLTADARFVAVDGGRERSVPAPSVRFFRGRVAGDPASRVVLTLFEGRLDGFIRTFGEEFGVAPRAFDLARPEALDVRVWNRAVAEPPAPESECAVEACGLEASGDGSAGFRLKSGGATVDGNTLLRAGIAADATVEWYQALGSLSAAQAQILSTIAQVSVIYESEVLVQLEVPYVRVFTSEPDPYTDGEQNTSALLSEMRAEWNATQTGVSRTAAHLFTYRSSGGAGTAYVDTLCDNDLSPGTGYDYGVSSIPGGGAAWEAALVAHEIGHNFASPHTHCYVPEIDRCVNQDGCWQGATQQTQGTIMSYCNDKDATFHSRVRDEALRPAAESAFPLCIDTAGEPGSVGEGLRMNKPNECPGSTLQNDDGSLDTFFGYTGTSRTAWIKRFTPGCYPYRLNRAEVHIGHSSVQVGRALRLLVFADPAGTGDPANATLIHTEDVTVQTVSSSTPNVYDLAAPPTVTAGDLYVGFYDLEADAGTTYIAAADFSSSGDSYRAGNSTAPGSFSEYANATWMIRASGGAVEQGSVLLDWDAPCNDATVPGQDFSVYTGALGDFSGLTPSTCSTGRDRTHLESGAPGSTFFVVVPSTTAVEGSYGVDGDGFERSPSTAACKTQSIGPCPGGP
ncbi:MAG: hypothetical protein GY716_15425 [bacterium]|nr:hypothetical protein [bacterium]